MVFVIISPNGARSPQYEEMAEDKSRRRVVLQTVADERGGRLTVSVAASSSPST